MNDTPEIVRELERRVRAMTVPQINAAIQIATDNKAIEDRIRVKHKANGYLAAAHFPNWKQFTSAIATAAVRAFAAGGEKEYSDRRPIVATLMAVTENAALGVMARGVLTPDEYALLTEPMLGIMPSLASEVGEIGSIPQEEVKRTMAVAQEEVKAKTAKAKTKTKKKAAVEPTGTEMIAAAIQPKAKAEVAKAEVQPAKEAKTVKAKAKADAKPKPEIVADAEKFAAKHSDTYERFLKEVPEYAMRVCTREVGRITVTEREKVAFLVMATMARDGEARLKKLAKAWAFWEPLATLAKGVRTAPETKEVVQVVAES